jgi:hypothetical protein
MFFMNSKFWNRNSDFSIFQQRNSKKNSNRYLWNQKWNWNSTSDGGPRNRNRKSEFPTKVDTATTTRGARATAFTAFLVLALFLSCLMAIMLLAEEYKSLFYCMKEYKGNCPLSSGCLGDAPGCRGTHFHVGQRSHGRPSFQ